MQGFLPSLTPFRYNQTKRTQTMKIFLLLLSPLLLFAKVHYAKVEPYESIVLKSSVSALVTNEKFISSYRAEIYMSAPSGVFSKLMKVEIK